ncbi:hypothetical protein EV363DRAFT_1193808 [Boletus edulis]|uniref:Uncharacterized protein n=1 Tax=Boletus edulis BED1 TaxID=1328754 RepID=A0AAD4G7T4_BOLED|nr:hypothetical protein EV363DRAFT_1193808 [Boletus edulis]KAF8425024.1 hypothetical protein L210DRAFT_984420 [Boletus edulis BED1]
MVRKTKICAIGPSILAYDVYVDDQPAPTCGRTLYSGDIHVWKSPNGCEVGISIYCGVGWISWDPSAVTGIRLTDRFAYPAPCPRQGLRYLEAASDVEHAVREYLPDLEALCQLIIDDTTRMDMDISIDSNPDSIVSHKVREAHTRRTRQTQSAIEDDDDGTILDHHSDGPHRGAGVRGILNTGKKRRIDDTQRDSMARTEQGIQTDLAFYSEEDVGRLTCEIQSRRAVEQDLRIKLDEACHNHEDTLQNLCSVRRAHRKTERENDNLLQMVARAERESIMLTAAIDATRTTSELLVRVREMFVPRILLTPHPIAVAVIVTKMFLHNVPFAVSMHCGHSICLQCGLSHWLRRIIRGTMDTIGLETTLCPICREPFPPVSRDPQTGGRLMACMPFRRNVQTDEMISQLFDDISAAMRELHAVLPHDPVVADWKSKYGRDDGEEWTRYQAESRQSANRWALFTTEVWPAETVHGIRAMGHVLDDAFHTYFFHAMPEDSACELLRRNAAIMQSIRDMVLVEGLGLVAENTTSTSMFSAMSDFLQALQAESDRHVRNAAGRNTEQWRHMYPTDLSGYCVLDDAQIAKLGKYHLEELIQRTAHQTTAGVEHEIPAMVMQGLQMRRSTSDDESLDIDWGPSSQMTQPATLPPWETGQVDAGVGMQERRYSWTGFRDAILERHAERAFVKFTQIPALLQIIWDAYWEALQHHDPAATQVANVIECTILQDCVRAPTQVQIRAMIDAIRVAASLNIYAYTAQKIYNVSHLCLSMRMVPSQRLEEFYRGALLDEWIRERTENRT